MFAEFYLAVAQSLKYSIRELSRVTAVFTGLQLRANSHTPDMVSCSVKG